MAEQNAMGTHGAQPQNIIDPSQGLRAQVSKQRLILILSSIMLGMLLSSVDQTVVGTAMPRIIADLHGLKEYAWVTTSYMLASTVMVPLYGKLSDIYGRKPFYLLGMALFLLGSALSGTSHDMMQLILYRGVQGLGGGAMMPIVLAIIGDIFPPAERGKWQGLLMAVFGLAAIVGPWAGGAITDHWGWRYVFYVNMPIGALALFIAAAVLPAAYRKSEHQVDYWGTLLLLVAAVPMLLAFSWAGNQYPWSAWQVLGGFTVSLLGWAAFFVWEGNTPEPIIAPELFKNGIFTVSVAASFFVWWAMFGAVMYIPLFMQAVIGDSASNSGIMLTPMILAFAISSVIGGQIMSRTGKYKLLSLVSLVIAVLGMVLLNLMNVSATNGMVMRAMIITGVGLGTLMSLFTIVVQNAFPLRMMGSVSANLQFFRSIGGTIGIAVLGSLLTGRFTYELTQQIPTPIVRVLPHHAVAMMANPSLLLSPQAKTELNHAFANAGLQAPILARELIHGVQVALSMAIDRVFMVSALALAIALVLTFFLREIPLSKHVASDPPSRERPSAISWRARTLAGVALARAVSQGRFDGNEIKRASAVTLAIWLLENSLYTASVQTSRARD